ncbi:MAG: VOC family protein [Gammaproteobacteria bacterium]|nr:VOC family protein [Gammaproteobacteria bacterium]
MGTRTQYETGTFCWPELATNDSEKAKDFYKVVFGWSWRDSPMPEGTYSMSVKDDSITGAMYQLTKDQIEIKTPPHWTTYISVTDLEKSLTRLESLGGKLNLGPHDVGDAGRMAFVEDPEGVRFALWQAKNAHGAELVNEPGSLCWNELATRDISKATEFYCGLFGWTAEKQTMSMGDYTMLLNGDKAAGGMMPMTAEWGDTPAHWMTYFAVADTDESCEKIKKAGGSVCVEPFDVPEVGRLAVVNDPQGAVFSIIKLDSPDP